MPQGSLAEILNQEILAAARAAVAELYKPVQMFADLPDVCGVPELAKYYNVSKDVITKMAREGMPHTHAGREFRFHKTLLEEWTRGGEMPYLCSKCTDHLNENSHQSLTDSNVVPAFTHTKARNREEKFARVAGNK